MERERRAGFAGWVHLMSMVIGLWLIMAPSVMAGAHGGDAPAQAVWNGVVVGLLVILVGAIGTRTNSAAPHWFEAGIGAWLMAAPIILWYGATNLGWSDMLMGLLLAFFGVIATVGKTWGVGQRARGL